MKVPTSDISRALLVELKVVRDKHQSFQIRVKAADKAARARDDEARKQNAVLTQRIGELETELKQAKDSIGALQEFIELLPSVKSEVDSFEDDIESFETLGSDSSGLERGRTISARVNALEIDISQITQLRSSPVTELSEIQSGSMSDFSLFDDSNLGIVTELMEQPLKNGDLWFIIPHMWFDAWKQACERTPNAIGMNVGPISTSTLLDQSGRLIDETTNYNSILYTKGSDMDLWRREESIRFNTRRKSIPASAWDRLLAWYGCDSTQFPRLVTPHGLGGSPCVDRPPSYVNVYFMFPPGEVPNRTEMYITKVLVPRDCLVKTLRSIITTSMPTYSRQHSIEFFAGNVNGTTHGWYASPSRQKAVLLEWQGDEIFALSSGSSIFVSVTVLDRVTGSMVPIDPFPTPACPPKIFTWSPSCA